MPKRQSPSPGHHHFIIIQPHLIHQTHHLTQRRQITKYCTGYIIPSRVPFSSQQDTVITLHTHTPGVARADYQPKSVYGLSTARTAADRNAMIPYQSASDYRGKSKEPEECRNHRPESNSNVAGVALWNNTEYWLG
jgi:hypothetical protein